MDIHGELAASDPDMVSEVFECHACGSPGREIAIAEIVCKREIRCSAVLVRRIASAGLRLFMICTVLPLV